MLAIWVYIIAVGGFQTYIVTKGETKDEEAFLASGADAEQALNAIKIVKAFGQETHEINKFTERLDERKNEIVKQSWYFGLGKGLLGSAMYFIPFYSQLIAGIYILSDVHNLNTDEVYTAGDVYASFLAIQAGAFHFGACFLNIVGFNKALV